MSTEDIMSKYGQPGDWDNIVDIHTPYWQIIAWDQSSLIKKYKCHRLIKPNLEAVHDCILHEYGEYEISKLGIDLWGGCYNLRKMRGGNKWSRHSWAIAVDLLPQGNGLRTKAPKALFSQPEYRKLIDIFYEHNFINYGIEKGYDWMHFEIAS